MKSRATQTKELDMVNGPLARKILIYSIPLMFSNLLQVFFNMPVVSVMMIVVEPTEPSALAPANFPTTATSVILKNT